jgi:DNA-binding transcriptional regulator YiaG
MKTLAHEPRLRKMPPREVIAKKVPARKTTKKTSAKTGIQAFNPSATSIARLRIRLGLTQAQFARLLGVSLPSVNNWENAVGKLKLRGKSTAALNRVALLGPAEAMQALSRMG